MAENKDNNNKKLLPKTPQRPNYQLWIILALFVLVIVVTYFNNSRSVIDITKTRFEQMVKAGDVREVIIISNNNEVEVTLKEEAIQNIKYKDEIEDSNPFSMSTGPHYKMRIVGPESFVEYYENLEAELPADQRIGYKIEERSDFTSIFFQWGFLFLILFGFWFLMRRMTGGGGPGGQIFNIGKSRAALFDSESKIKITFVDVAGYTSLLAINDDLELLIEVGSVDKGFKEAGYKPCDYCISGKILAVYSLLEEHPTPDDITILKSMSGNKCICSDVTSLINGVKNAAQNRKRKRRVRKK